MGDFFIIIIFFPPHLLSSPFYSLSLLVVTQIRGHIAGPPPPLPARVRALHVVSRRHQLFLPWSIRVEFTVGAHPSRY